jgi:hypothetical protein
MANLGSSGGFVPCFGAPGCINIPFVVVGLIFSIIAASKAEPGNKGGATAGIVCCAIAALFGLIRLVMGGGIL